MISVRGVTFLAATVLTLVSSFSSVASTAATATTSSPAKKVLTVNQNKTLLPDLSQTQDPEFHINFSVSKSTSLVDFQDGTRKDGMDYQLAPSFKTSYGVLSTRIAYSQNLREDSPSTALDDSDWADAPISFAFNAVKWFKNSPIAIAMTPSVTAVMPISQISVRRDQLQTTLIGGLNFRFFEGGALAAKKDGSWVVGLSLTGGRSFHAYEENINGAVLNQYLSNQALNLSYTYKVVSFVVDYAHKTRWTYQGGVRDSFELSEEIGWAVNETLSLAVGHSNGGSSLKPDGSESNFSVYNENDSTVYVQMGVSF